MVCGSGMGWCVEGGGCGGVGVVMGVRGVRVVRVVVRVRAGWRAR